MAKKPSSSTTTRKAPAGEPPSVTDAQLADARVVILSGTDAYLRQLFTQRLREVLAKAHAPLDAVLLAGEQAKPADVLDECRSMGLMGGHKLVIIDDAERLLNADSRPAFERYAANPSDSATLVLRAGAKWNPGKLDDIVEEHGLVLRCEQPSDAYATRWAIERAKAHHRATLAPDAAAALIDRVGPNLAQIDSELGKLSVASGASNAITLALVREFVGASREEEVWSIQSVLVHEPAPAALAQMHHMLTVGRVPAQLMMYAVTDLARKLHHLAAGTKAGLTPFEVAGAIRLWGPSRDALIQASRRAHPARTLAFLEACIEADERAKSGLGDTERSLEVLALQLRDVLGASPR